MRRVLRSAEQTVAPDASSLTALAMADLRSARLTRKLTATGAAKTGVSSSLKGYPALAPELKRLIDARRVIGRRAHEDRQIMGELGLIEKPSQKIVPATSDEPGKADETGTAEKPGTARQPGTASQPGEQACHGAPVRRSR